MTSHEKKKAPALGGATGAIRNRTTNYQKEETMTSTVPQLGAARKPFDVRIPVQIGFYGTATVEPVTLLDNSAAVSLDFGDEGGIKTISPAIACALAAALQAAAVHAMEEASTDREAA